MYRGNLSTGKKISVSIPKIYYGLPLNNSLGQTIYSSNQARDLAVVAYNRAELKIFSEMASTLVPSSFMLRQHFEQYLDEEFKLLTNGVGKVTKQPSLNPIQAIPVNPYKTEGFFGNCN